jgi:hypothetical protein
MNDAAPKAELDSTLTEAHGSLERQPGASLSPPADPAAKPTLLPGSNGEHILQA